MTSNNFFWGLAVKGAKWIYNEEGHEIQQSQFFMTTDALTCIRIFFLILVFFLLLLKSKYWSEFWLKDLWWGLAPSVLLVTPCRTWQCTLEMSKWEWLVIVTDVNIDRIDVEDRNNSNILNESTLHQCCVWVHC